MSIKVLIVDDSATFRKIIKQVVLEIEDLELLGMASNGRIALQKIELACPELILLDVAMAEMDGLETLKHVKEKYPGIDVVMISGINPEGADITLQSLDAGALDFIPKPRHDSMEKNHAELKSAILRLLPLVQARRTSFILKNKVGDKPLKSISHRIVKEDAGPGPAVSEKTYIRIKRAGVKRVDVVAIGVSTGGPNALQEIVPEFPGNFPVPVMIVQHMPPMFTATLAERLNASSAVHVLEASNNQNIEAGKVYIAPGGRHMVVRTDLNGDKKIGIVDTPPVNSCRPAVDVLFRSIGLAYGGNVISVILTGMGRDGASGVAALRRKGGYSIVQDEQSSLIWGMPRAVAEEDNADEIIPLNKIISRVIRLTDEYR